MASCAVANGCGFDDFAALRDLIDRLTDKGHPHTTIAGVCEGYALRLPAVRNHRRRCRSFPSRRSRPEPEGLAR